MHAIMPPQILIRMHIHPAAAAAAAGVAGAAVMNPSEHLLASLQKYSYKS